jgi:predicted secreted protein
MRFSVPTFYRHFGWAVLVSELSHVFCCVIPTLVTVLSALANIGLFSATPGFLMDVHSVMHTYEMPIISFSGAMMVLGWAAHIYGNHVDCHDTGCGHPPCSPQKTKNTKILIVATVLFMVNIVIYFGVHRNVLHLDIFRPHGIPHEHHDETL